MAQALTSLLFLCCLSFPGLVDVNLSPKSDGKTVVNESESQLQKLKLQGVKQSWISYRLLPTWTPESHQTPLPLCSEQASQSCRACAVSLSVLLHPFQASQPEARSQSHTESSEAEVALIRGEVLSQGDLTQSLVEGCQPPNTLRPLRKEGADEQQIWKRPGVDRQTQVTEVAGP